MEAVEKVFGLLLADDPALASKNKVIFMGSETPTAFDMAQKWVDAKGNSGGPRYRLTYTHLLDRRTLPSSVGQMQANDGIPKDHHELEYLSYLLNLQLALRAHAFVCTMASNTCRLIDEMRATSGSKASAFYADLSAETCDHPPCIGTGIKDFSY